MNEQEFTCDPRPSHVSETEWEAADVAYLERRKQSDERRLQEVALFEMDVMRRLGYL